MTDQAAEIPALASVPRALTRVARKRSWNEMPVRIWMILTLAVLIVTVYFVFTRTREAMIDRWLIQNGLSINAKYIEVDGDPFPKRRLRTQPMQARVSYSIKGVEYTLYILLEPKKDTPATVGQEIAIKVDPNNPLRWTEQTEPRPWLDELAIVLVLVPLLVLVFLVMVFKRYRVLKVFRESPLAEAVVVETRQTPAAPFSRIVRFTLQEGEDRRIWTTLMPTSAGIPHAGEPLLLICPQNNPGKAIVASLYEEPG